MNTSQQIIFPAQGRHTQVPRSAEFSLPENEIAVLPLDAVHIPDLVRLQRLNFPTLAESELLDKSQYERFLEIFPQGQFVATALQGGISTVIGSTTTFRTELDPKHIRSSFLDIVAGFGVDGHHTEGNWLYGVDLNVHPSFRGKQVGRRLYDRRTALVHQLNLRGEIAGAMLPGYEHHSGQMSVAQYVLRVHQGRLYDLTLSMQLRNGFHVKGILYDYLSDPRSQKAAALIVRENRLYRPA